MRDRSKQLLVINTGKKQSEQTGMTSQSGTTHIIGGGRLSVNMSDYLLKSIWDKVFEIRTDSQGIEYIFGKLPVVTQYGITMYSGDGVNVPSLASGLPFDGRTIWYNPDTQQIEVIGGTGGGSGEGVSNFWDLSGIPSWITNSKPKYTYSEIEGTPDLSGFATQNWIISQGYASAEELKKYIPISGYTEVSGEKNFTGGLKVNGSPIYYDTAKKYWKFEGDLLVTGGVTMYGNEGTYTPSTIMDAIVVDETTISKSGGVLKVIGGTGGGVADSVAWANITGKPNFASVATSGKYNDLIGKPTLLSSFTDDVVSGKYLPLSGGILKGVDNVLVINRTNLNQPCISYEYNGTSYGSLGLKGYGDPFVYNASTKVLSQIYHKENISTLKTDLGLGSNAYTSTSYLPSSSYTAADILTKLKTVDGSGSGLDADLLDGKQPSELNVDSASKLQTARTIWGQSFDGTGNVSGMLKVSEGNAKIYWQSDSNNYYIHCPAGHGGAYLEYAAYGGHAFLGGNVGIGTTSPKQKLHVEGHIWANGDIAAKTKIHSFGSLIVNGNAGIGTESPAQKLDVIGKVKADALYLTRSNGSVAFTISEEKGTNGYNIIASGGTSYIRFYTNYTSGEEERMRIDSYGNVGIGKTIPEAKLHILSTASYSCIIDSSYTAYGYNYGSVDLRLNNVSKGTIGVNTVPSSLGTSNTAGFYFHNRVSGEYMNFYNEGGTFLKSNLLVNGGITMYSDQRKKTILNHVELSLKQIANAPLIEHYYNSDDKKTTHVGSIAQYWASMNDWFCKLDSEGYYTMEIQNAALASAISIARELDRYESKTDKTINKLKKKIALLEEEVEQLRSRL